MATFNELQRRYEAQEHPDYYRDELSYTEAELDEMFSDPESQQAKDERAIIAKWAPGVKKDRKGKTAYQRYLDREAKK